MEFIEHLLAHYPEEEVKSLLKAMEKEPVHGLLLNTAKMDAETLLQHYPLLRPHPFVPNAFLYEKDVYDLGKSLLFDLGVFYIMDPASMAVAHFLSPKPGMRVLDLCAAPGGKSVHASLLMGGQGAILSNDLSYPRAKELSKNIERMGIGNVAVISDDLAKKAERYQGYFDAIILDAPCSGSATFRKSEAAKEDWTYEKVSRLSVLQKELLDASFSMLKPGGRIAYSTCSFSYEEDEEVVLSFLSNHPDARLLPIDCNEAYHHRELPEAIHLFPSRMECEGQFLALIEKEGELLENQEPNNPAPKKLRELAAICDASGDFRLHGEALYRLPKPLRILDSPCLRPGLKIGEAKEPYLPDFALARNGGFAGPSLELNQEQALCYLNGETFPIEKEKGFALVRYHNLPLGFVKIVGGTAKNHYPKGLRRRYYKPLLP